MRIEIPGWLKISTSKQCEVEKAVLCTGATARPGQRVDWPAGAAVVVYSRTGRTSCIVCDGSLSPTGLHSDGSRSLDPDQLGSLDVDDLVV